MSISVGDKAPDFKLYNTEKKEVSLADLRGRNVVLLFFPAAFTGVCTDELCGIRDTIQDYNDLNATVLGISVDMPFTLAKYKEDQNYNFDLLSDFNKEVSSAYDTLYEEFVLGLRGVSKRSAFVIDKDGKIAYAEVLENAGELPNIDAVKKTLSELNAK